MHSPRQAILPHTPSLVLISVRRLTSVTGVSLRPLPGKRKFLQFGETSAIRSERCETLCAYADPGIASVRERVRCDTSPDADTVRQRRLVGTCVPARRSRELHSPRDAYPSPAGLTQKTGQVTLPSEALGRAKLSSARGCHLAPPSTHGRTLKSARGASTGNCHLRARFCPARRGGEISSTSTRRGPPVARFAG